MMLEVFKIMLLLTKPALVFFNVLPFYIAVFIFGTFLYWSLKSVRKFRDIKARKDKQSENNKWTGEKS